MAEEKETTSKYYCATGRRKTAVASVKLTEGTGIFTCNKVVSKPSALILTPLELASKKGKYDITVKVSGGGKQSQLEAIRLGIARGLVKSDEEFRTTLKKSGLLTRDPREKERKKYGLKRARKAPQWSKR